MPKRIRTAVVGLGWVARHRHLPVMERSSDYAIMGVIDRAPNRAQAISRQRGYRYFAESSTLSGISWLAEVDAIIVTAAPLAHFMLIQEALCLNKHVLTEKPFTMTVEQGEQLRALAGLQKMNLAVVHNFQFARSFMKLQAAIQSGKMGQIQSVAAVQLGNPRRRLPIWREQLPLGLFYDESPHLLYLLRTLAGEIHLLQSFFIKVNWNAE